MKNLSSLHVVVALTIGALCLAAGALVPARPCCGSIGSALATILALPLLASLQEVPLWMKMLVGCGLTAVSAFVFFAAIFAG